MSTDTRVSSRRSFSRCNNRKSKAATILAVLFQFLKHNNDDDETLFVSSSASSSFVFVTASVTSPSNPINILHSSNTNNNNNNNTPPSLPDNNKRSWSLWSSQIKGGNSSDDGGDHFDDDDDDDDNDDFLNELNDAIRTKKMGCRKDTADGVGNHDDDNRLQKLQQQLTVPMNDNNNMSVQQKSQLDSVSATIWPPVNPVDWASIETDAEDSDGASINVFDWDIDESSLSHKLKMEEEEFALLARQIAVDQEQNASSFLPAVQARNNNDVLPNHRDESFDSDSSSSSDTVSSRQIKSLETIKKLQQMLEETDYKMSTTRNSDDGDNNKISQRRLKLKLKVESPISAASVNPVRSQLPNQTHDNNTFPADNRKLWTSKDRSKYKKQQKKLRRAQLRLLQQQILDRKLRAMRKQNDSIVLKHRQTQQPTTSQQQSFVNQIKTTSTPKLPKKTVVDTSSQPQMNPPQIAQSDNYSRFSKSIWHEDDETDYEDGLGYTLPNLPVYYSDDEGSGSDDFESDMVHVTKIPSHHDSPDTAAEHTLIFQQHQQQQLQQQLQQQQQVVHPSLIPAIDFTREQKYQKWKERQKKLRFSTDSMQGDTSNNFGFAFPSEDTSNGYQDQSKQQQLDGIQPLHHEFYKPDHSFSTTALSNPLPVTQEASSIIETNNVDSLAASKDLEKVNPSSLPAISHEETIPSVQFGMPRHRSIHEFQDDRHSLYPYGKPQQESSVPFPHPLLNPYYATSHNRSMYPLMPSNYQHFASNSQGHIGQHYSPFYMYPIPPPFPYMYQRSPYYSAQEQSHAAWNTRVDHNGNMFNQNQPEIDPHYSALTQDSGEQFRTEESSSPYLTENLFSKSRAPDNHRHDQVHVRTPSFKVASTVTAEGMTLNPSDHSQLQMHLTNQKSMVASDTGQSALTGLSTTTSPKQEIPFSLLQSVEPSIEKVGQTLAEATSNVSYSSLAKISLICLMGALLCYSAVSPRTLPLTEYNLRFFENIRLLVLATIGPSVIMMSVFDAQFNNDINAVINTFFFAYTAGYVLTFVAEIFAATIIRLGVFRCLEPRVFRQLSPRVPIVMLPWVIRNNRYRPKRITLLAADFITSCLASPVIEEYAKLFVLQLTTTLPRNFNWLTKTSVKKRKKKRRVVAEPIVRQDGDLDIINANQYVTSMLAASIGLKLCDAIRRILMYTKPHQTDKFFYAVCRGWFPIHELCGTLTALGLAKRDLLGVRMPMWKLLAPAVVVHSMANLRGMKPIFKWNSSTPWSEMQLSPLNVPMALTLPQLLKKGYGKLMWAILLSRVLGYCVKNYYMINRQAMKRTTTYAGKHSAFSAEIATTAMLRSQEVKSNSPIFRN